MKCSPPLQVGLWPSNSDSVVGFNIYSLRHLILIYSLVPSATQRAVRCLLSHLVVSNCFVTPCTVCRQAPQDLKRV